MKKRLNYSGSASGMINTYLYDFMDCLYIDINTQCKITKFIYHLYNQISFNDVVDFRVLENQVKEDNEKMNEQFEIKFRKYVTKNGSKILMDLTNKNVPIKVTINVPIFKSLKGMTMKQIREKKFFITNLDCEKMKFSMVEL